MINLLKQKFDSASTSQNQIPCVAKKVDWNLLSNKNVLDFGGGKYDLFKNYVSEYDVNMFVYDLYNRTQLENKQAKACKPQLVTCCNVLNVIEEDEIINEIIKEIAEYKVNAIFCTYEGNKTNEGKITIDNKKSTCYQRNEKAINYISKLEKHFSNVIRKGNIFYCS